MIDTLENLPDVRRTIKISKPMTGENIAAVVEQFAKSSNDESMDNFGYVKKLLSDIDGNKKYLIGIASDYPHGSVIIRTGENLNNTAIDLNGSYSKIGVGSSYPLREKLYACGLNDIKVIENVELIRNELELLLNE